MKKEKFLRMILKEADTIFKKNEGIVIGKKLANKLRVKLGDSIKIISSKSYETLLAISQEKPHLKSLAFLKLECIYMILP